MNEPQYLRFDKFDKTVGSLSSRADVTKTKAATLTVESPVIGTSQYTVQTYRVKDIDDARPRDYVTIVYVDGDGSQRLVLPPQVADAIVRQRDALSKVNRRRASSATGKRLAAERKARGELPAFMQKRKRGK